MDKKKQVKFEELYLKFVRKCLTEDMLPVMMMDYRPQGILPTLNFRIVEEEEKKEILSSLSKEK